MVVKVNFAEIFNYTDNEQSHNIIYRLCFLLFFFIFIVMLIFSAARIIKTERNLKSIAQQQEKTDTNIALLAKKLSKVDLAVNNEEIENPPIYTQQNSKNQIHLENAPNIEIESIIIGQNGSCAHILVNGEKAGVRVGDFILDGNGEILLIDKNGITLLWNDKKILINQ